MLMVFVRNTDLLIFTFYSTLNKFEHHCLLTGLPALSELSNVAVVVFEKILINVGSISSTGISSKKKEKLNKLENISGMTHTEQLLSRYFIHLWCPQCLPSCSNLRYYFFFLPSITIFASSLFCNIVLLLFFF